MPDIATQELIDRINALTREEAMEAALAFAESVTEDDPEQTPALRDYIGEVDAEPYAHIAEVEDLARMALLAASLDSERRPRVDEIVNAVGQKAFIFGGAEIVALAGLAVVALATVLGKGKASEKEHVEVADGKLIYERETVYVAGTGVAKRLANLLPGR